MLHHRTAQLLGVDDGDGPSRTVAPVEIEAAGVIVRLAGDSPAGRTGETAAVLRRLG